MLTGGEWWRLMPTGASPDALLIAAAQFQRVRPPEGIQVSAD